VETLEELRMVSTIANDNGGNVVSLEDYREPIDTRAMEFFDALADEYLNKEVLLIKAVVMYKDEKNILSVKNYKLD
jgi:hypothetical protein